MNREFEPMDLASAEPDDERLTLADPVAPGELRPEQLDAWLDQLVDGEVAESQRRALLSRLERSPGGWRRCALAFLESQAWREALSPGALTAHDDETSFGCESRSEATSPRELPPAPAVSPPLGSPRLAWHWRPVLGMVAAAASFAVAFGLGLLVHKTWLSPRAANGGAAVVGRGGVSDAPVEPVAGVAKSPQPGETRWGAVQFVVDGPEGSPEQVRLPAVDGPDPERWLREQPPAIPDEIVQELRRRGHHVETQRRYLPVPLDDGRSAVFPVDQVDVRFRGGNGYQ